MKKINYRIAFILLSVIISAPLYAKNRAKKNWSDLFADDRPYYGSEKEEKLSVNLFFVEKEDWKDHFSLKIFWLFKYTDYPQMKRIYFQPFYYNLKSKFDNREKTYSIIGLYYNKINGPEELTLWGPYYSSIKARSADRSLFYLFWWGNSRRVYNNKKTAYAFFLPLLFYRSGKQYTLSNMRYDKEFQISPFYFYSSTKITHTNSKSSATRTFGMPLIPLIYFDKSPKRGHINFLWLSDIAWTVQKDTINWKRFWFFLWYQKFGSNGYLHIVPPVVINTWSPNGEYYSHFIPFWITWKTVRGKYNKKRVREYEYSIFTPLFRNFKSCKGGKKWEGDCYYSTFWIGPFVPIFFYRHYEKNYGTHYNIAGLIDWKLNAGGGPERFWFIPFFFHRFGRNGYTHILPPLFISSRSDSGESFMHILPPLFMSWKSIDSRYNGKTKKIEHIYKKSVYSILFGRFTKSRGENKWDEKPFGKTLWVGPFIPFFYYHYEKNYGTHYNIAGLIDWKQNTDNSLERLWIIPFVFFKPGKSGYRYYAPFYFKPSGWTAERGYSYGLFHYHRWSPEKNVIWSWLFYSQNNPLRGTHYAHFIPFYWSWKTEKTKGSLIIPWSFEYESRKKSLYINIIGISRSVALGPAQPDVSLDFGKIKGNWYFDTDISWMYEIFSFSSRITVKNPFRKKKNLNISKLEEKKFIEEGLVVKNDSIDKSGAPAITEEKKFTRGQSEYFWGIKVLFGLFAIERADSKRHFRLLPLSWLTWDEKSKDKLYATPISLSYRSESNDLEYFVIFPFYGHQRQGKSYSTGYLLNLFWDEYSDKEKLKEITVLWPIFNWYSSPKKSGWRFFPFVWRKKYTEKGARISKWISPLHYSNYKTDEKGNVLLYKHVINPFYYSKSRFDKNTLKTISFFPIAPLVFKKTSKTVNSPFINGAKTGISDSESSYIYKEDSFLCIFPFYFHNYTMRSASNGMKEEYFSLYALPLLHYEQRKYDADMNKTENAGGRKLYGKDYSLFFFTFEITQNRDIFANSFLFGLWSYTYNTKSRTTGFKLLYGLFSYSGSKEKSRTRLFPFYYRHYSPELKELSLLLGIYGSRRKVRKIEGGLNGVRRIESEWKLLYGIAGSSQFYRWKYHTLNNRKGTYVKTEQFWFMPFYYCRTDNSTDSKNRYAGKTSLSPLWYYNGKSLNRGSSEKFSETYFFPIPGLYIHSSHNGSRWNLLGFIDRKISKNRKRFFIFPLYYNSVRHGAEHTNIIGILDRKKNNKGKLERLLALPFVMWYPGEKERELYILPLFTYFGKTEKDKTAYILGTYWYESSDFERQNIWYLYDHKKYIKTDKDSYDFIFGAIHYEKSPELKNIRLFWGGLADFKNYRNSENYDFSMLFSLINVKRANGIFHHHFIPLYWYNGRPDGWELYTPLGYLSKGKEGDFDLGLWGLLYYRNNKLYKKTDLRLWLLGTVYYEVKKPEKGYHSEGSLGGLLWEHETEKETGFEKWTILKGWIYKKVVLKNRVKRRILGISF